MPSDPFYWLVNMSLTATAAGLAVLLLRRVRGVPRLAVYALWGVVGLRMVLPFSFAAPFSPMALATSLTSLPVPWGSDPGQGVSLNHLRAATSYFPIVYRTPALALVFGIGSVVWLVGLLAALVALAVSAATAARIRRGAVPIGDGLWRSDRIDTPMVVGILRPRVVVPDGLDATTLRWALRHEEVHRRRRDNLWRAIAAVVCAVHWFNPLAWVFLRAFRQDLEDACDAAVLKGRTAEERTEYARTLFAYAQRGGRTPVAAFRGGNVRRRIDRVLTYRALTVGALVGFVVLWAAVAAVLLANPAS